MALEVGSIIEGKVTGLTKFGAFVDIGDGKVGMVHISEVASTFVNEISEFLEEGQTVKVKVLTVDDNGKISLSIKKADENYAQTKSERPQGQRPPYQKREKRSNPNVWTGPKTAPANDGNMSFEEMMSKFKQVSDEKMTDLKRSSETKHGGGFSRRGGRGHK